MNIFYLEILAVITAILCVGLATLNSKWNWIFGIISTIAYAYIFQEKSLYFQFALQIFFIIQSTIGFFMWSEKGNIIKKLSIDDKHRFYGFIGLILIIFLTLNHSIVHIIEVIIAFTSVVATFVLMKRKSVAWLLWSIVNILSIIFFYLSDMYLTMCLYVLFLGNSVFAFYKWEEE
jgi:nicotinamide mononucleotide transporter